ncbi:hypothetical protein Bbelb_275810 [Branchiostoma belcheri]|nr:hypothetical protein Bbelb_275810 [Branchiostoma belcheri]
MANVTGREDGNTTVTGEKRETPRAARLRQNWPCVSDESAGAERWRAPTVSLMANRPLLQGENSRVAAAPRELRMGEGLVEVTHTVLSTHTREEPWYSFDKCDGFNMLQVWFCPNTPIPEDVPN